MIRTQVRSLAIWLLALTSCLLIIPLTTWAQGYYECVYHNPVCCGVKVTVMDLSACGGRGPGLNCTQYLQQFPQDADRVCAQVREKGVEICPELAEACKQGECQICDDKAAALRDRWDRVIQALGEEREKHRGRLFTDPPDPKPVSARVEELWKQRNVVLESWEMLKDVCWDLRKCAIGRNIWDLAASPSGVPPADVSPPDPRGGGGGGSGPPGSADPDEKTWEDPEEKDFQEFLYPLRLWLLEQQAATVARDLETNSQELENQVRLIQAKEAELETARGRNDPEELDWLSKELKALALQGADLYTRRQDLNLKQVTLEQELKNLREKLGKQGPEKPEY